MSATARGANHPQRAFPCISADALFQHFCCLQFRRPIHLPESPFPSISLKLLWHLPCLAEAGITWTCPLSFTFKSVTHLSVLFHWHVWHLSPCHCPSGGPYCLSPGFCSRLPVPEPALMQGSSTLLPRKSFQHGNLMPAHSLKSFNAAPPPSHTMFPDLTFPVLPEFWVVKKSQKSGFLCEFPHPFLFVYFQLLQCTH